MKPKDKHKAPAATGTPPSRRRFRIEKLEERIAPKKGGNGKGGPWKTGLCDTERGC